MRWEDLFADLELQWEANEAAELASELADRSRREAGYLRMIDRMRPVVGYPTRLRVLGGQHAGESLHGTLAALGMDWLLLAEPGATEALVPMRALLAVENLSVISAAPGHEGPLGAKLDLRYVLRGLVRDRSTCTLRFVDGTTLHGTPVRVGADFLEVAEHAVGEFARRGQIRSGWTLPLNALAYIRRIP
ncbi:hypothetical protein MXD61_11585 [Frankia sp. AgPm24]|uniref:hypothetical protein n=1 Tax=Frankia sp. AgPm24 TaxID=631128 RepID=UPI00200E0E2B|nr:hypothetical protein [Frankia sp. AgPm24]MCK9922512.1 hypothetical protein [Frankia sp. AgPm24]